MLDRAMKPPAIERSTKCCELILNLTTGVKMVGTYHVSTVTSSSVRPSDALRDCQDGFLLLTNVTIHGNSGTQTQTAAMVRMDAISYIELPPKGWTVRTPALA